MMFTPEDIRALERVTRQLIDVGVQNSKLPDVDADVLIYAALDTLAHFIATVEDGKERAGWFNDLAAALAARVMQVRAYCDDHKNTLQ